MSEYQKESSWFESVLAQLAVVRVALLFLFHAAVFAACYAFAYFVRFDFVIPEAYVHTLRSSVPIVVSIQLVTGAFFGFYRGWWRYVGMAEVVRLVIGLSVSFMTLMAAWYLLPYTPYHADFRPPRGVLLTDWAFCLLSLFGVRVLIRVARDRFRPSQDMPHRPRRVLIVGAGDAGESLAREIEHRPQLGLKVVAFVDDQRTKWRSHIRGIRVFGPISNIAALADSLDATEALIAIPSASGKRMREIIHHLSEADLQFKTIPGLDHIVSGKVHVTQLRPVNVEDLLRRKRIDLPGDPARTLFRGKKIMVTGAGGTIGSELAAQILRLEPETLVLIERSEFALYEARRRLATEAAWAATRVSSNLVDIRDVDCVRDLIARERPDILLHAAAHKHVPLGEENPPEYVRNNALTTRQLAETAAEYGCQRFVLISTDKAINPTSVMGASKRAAEILLLDAAPSMKMRTTVVRFGNVIGSSGSVIPLFMEQIAAGGPITVTHPDVTRYFIRTSEAISLVLQAATLGDDGQVFMLDMGEPVRIVELARDLIRLSNHTEDEIPIVFTGLRPGEKLFEEIRLEGESIHPTVHPQIVVTEASQPDVRAVRQWLDRARSLSRMSAAETRAFLNDLIPEYVSPQAMNTPDAAQFVAVPSGEAVNVPELQGT